MFSTRASLQTFGGENKTCPSKRSNTICTVDFGSPWEAGDANLQAIVPAIYNLTANIFLVIKPGRGKNADHKGADIITVFRRIAKPKHLSFPHLRYRL